MATIVRPGPRCGIVITQPRAPAGPAGTLPGPRQRLERTTIVPGSFSLIVNPVAGGGRSLRLLPAVTGELDALGQPYQVIQSASLTHAREVATAAGQAGRVIVAIGGDGMA